MTDDEVDDYIRYLHEQLPSAHARLSVDAVRAVLDAEADYYQRRFGPIHGWRALLREMFGRGHPVPASVDAALPEFEQYVLTALGADERYSDVTADDIRAVMRVEGEAGPNWTPPAPADTLEESTDTMEESKEEFP